MQNEQLHSMHWEIARLLEMGVEQEFVEKLNVEETRDLLKGLLYLREKWKEAQQTSSPYK